MQNTKERKSVSSDSETKRAQKKEEIRRRMSQAIVDNRLPPGAKLREEALAEFFGVSRARVREALVLLAEERLVTLVPNRGAFVAEPSVDETRQICEARRVIELAMVRSAAASVDRREIVHLRGLIAAERRSWDDQDQHSAIRYSREFHLGIADLAGNAILAETLRNILFRSALSAVLYGERNNPGCLCDDHFAIIDALEAGDAEGAVHLMDEHLEQIERRLDLRDSSDDVSLEDALRHTE